MRRCRRAALAWLGLVVVMLAIIPAAEAHRTSAGSTAGIPIPSLTHGQMAVIAENRTAILALADAQAFQDETFQRLRNFVDLQYLHCLWGLIPGSGDEESPFNECSHAYLSGTQALLLHMPRMRGDQSRVDALIRKIDLQMLMNHASLVLCRYSDEPFNTAEIVSPHWRDLPAHPPSLLSLLAMGILSMSGAIAIGRYLLSPNNQAPASASS